MSTSNTITKTDLENIINAIFPATTEDMTQAQIDAFIASLNCSGTSILDKFYPVGSYYETSDTTFDPNVTWGGTWVLELEGMTHISAGANYTVSGALTNTTDGGSATVTLTASEIPAHNHKIPDVVFRYVNKTSLVASGSNGIKAFSEDSGVYTNNNTGGGGAHNNMQPYIVVNRWHRTA